MKRVCAWCGLELGAAESDGERTTHGVCPLCRKLYFPSQQDAAVPAAPEADDDDHKKSLPVGRRRRAGKATR